MRIYGVLQSANVNGRIRFGGAPDEAGLWRRSAQRLELVKSKTAAREAALRRKQ